MTVGAPTNSPNITDTATCLGCGYPLRGLDGWRCPECGRSFDPSDSETMNAPLSRERRRRRRVQHWAPLVVWVVTLFAVLAAVLFAALGLHIDIDLTMEWLLIIGIVLASIARAATRQALGVPSAGRREWLFPITILAFCLYLTFPDSRVQYRTCPHGTMLAFGPVGIARSTVGGPCRNTLNYRWAWNVQGSWYVCVTF